jgi:ornithine carbamoyltransferase
MQTVSAGPLPQMQTWCDDLISINDLGPTGVGAVLDLASLMKARPEDFRGALAGKQVVMFFEKPSLRTRLERSSATSRTISSAGSMALSCAPSRTQPSPAWPNMPRFL